MALDPPQRLHRQHFCSRIRQAMATFYVVLGVSVTATSKEIEAAYKSLILRHHPDWGGDHEYASEIIGAHEATLLLLPLTFLSLAASVVRTLSLPF